MPEIRPELRQDKSAVTHNLVVALRTHIWDADVLLQAQRLHESASGLRFVILADESREILQTAPYEKISHQDDYTGFGLVNFPDGKVLWYNADYPLYTLRRKFPQASHFAMVEYDVAVNIDMAALLCRAAADGIDLITQDVGDAAFGWMWTVGGARVFNRPLKSFLPVMVVSARAIDHMLARRQVLARGPAPVSFDDWPFCETFIPSCVAELPEYKMTPLAAEAQMSRFNLYDYMHVNDPEAGVPGSLRHPVLGSAAIIGRKIMEASLQDIFATTSNLRRALEFCKVAKFGPALWRRVREFGDAAALAQFGELAAAQGWPAEAGLRNLVPGRLTALSSKFNGEMFEVGDAYAFHTNFETDPWWQVDFQIVCEVSHAVITNRRDIPERCINFSIYASEDGEVWRLQAAKLDGVVFGADGMPYRMDFTSPFAARYVRLVLVGENYLHLAGIELYGEPV